MKVYDPIISAESVAMRMKYGHPWDDIRRLLIEDHTPIARRVGHSVARKRGKSAVDLVEYGSVAVEGLVEAVERLEKGESTVEPVGVDITKFLVRNMSGHCINFLSKDSVVPVPFRSYTGNIMCGVDVEIRQHITDCHDFLNDFVDALNVSECEKKMLIFIGQGQGVHDAAILAGMHHSTAYRVLEKIRRWVV